MRARRLFWLTLAAALPLLVVALVAAAPAAAPGVLAVLAGWLLGVAIVVGVLWRRLGRPVAEVLDDLEVGAVSDIRWALREQRESAEACQVERARTAELLEDLSSSLGEGLLVVGDDLRVRLINPVAQRFCGASRVAAGALFLEVVRDPEVVAVVEAASGGEARAPVVVSNPRGLWELRAFPVRQGGAVVLVSDVSLVRRASEFRRRFVQDLSHELRSPLTVLRTTVEAVEDELPHRIADILVRQVVRIDRLASELAELASLESGQMVLELEAVRLAPVVAEVVGDFEPEARARGLEVRVDVAADLACRCDRRGLYRVLSNLLDNAVKYNREGGWVEIHGAVDHVSGTLAVADSGVGIPAGELQAVLQRFYRLDRGRTPGSGGLGLGLAIVKHIVQQMGGRLDLDSREGVGTRVMVTLPLAGEAASSSGLAGADDAPVPASGNSHPAVPGDAERVASDPAAPHRRGAQDGRGGEP